MSAARVPKIVKAADRIKYWNIAVGDEVRVLTGPSRGKVGKVIECQKDKNKVVVAGVNILRRLLPRVLAQKMNQGNQRLEYAGPIHYSNVQLVGNLPSSADPTGPTRRVEIKRVNRGKTFYNKDKKLTTWRRWVPGENVFLPWPRSDHARLEGPMDTKEADVAANTYFETLHKSPIPSGMQDELRQKYSKFRRSERAVSIDEISGLEQGSTDTTGIETPVKAAQATVDRSAGPTAGLDPKTIDILAQAMMQESQTTTSSAS